MALKGSATAKLFIFFTLLGVLPSGAGNVGSQADPPSYRLRLYHLHTGEHIDVVYRIGDQYLPDRVAELDHFLRDHRTGDVKDYDLKEFDLLHDLMIKLGHPDGEIDIVCGYRTRGAITTCGNMGTGLPSIASTWKQRPSIFAFQEFPARRFAMRRCLWAAVEWAITRNRILFT